ncbi:hypothetical protein BDV97DRAFT_421521 [Delphinella strobiligena]|nr:hypothetical protein BDV97DRAFT_421521 [Delphinella strobiligena]
MNQRNNDPTPKAVVKDALPTSFFDLPPETRNTVYESALSSDYHEPRTNIRDVVEPPVLHTCHQLREESLKMFWSRPLQLNIGMPKWGPKQRCAPYDRSLKCFRHLARTGRLSLIRDLGVTVYRLNWEKARLLLPFLEIIRNNETVRINYKKIEAHLKGPPD